MELSDQKWNFQNSLEGNGTFRPKVELSKQLREKWNFQTKVELSKQFRDKWNFQTKSGTFQTMKLLWRGMELSR